jgi:hypothetical protein
VQQFAVKIPINSDNFPIINFPVFAQLDSVLGDSLRMPYHCDNGAKLGYISIRVFAYVFDFDFDFCNLSPLAGFSTYFSQNRVKCFLCMRRK